MNLPPPAPIRTPTPASWAFAWWRAALADQREDLPPIVIDAPQAGYYRRRLVRGGPWVPARIWLVSPTDPVTGELTAPEWYACEVNGEVENAQDQWPWLAGEPIPEAEFRYLTDLGLHASYYAPKHPAANPRQAIDFHTLPPPKF